ncbi:hypothetical protein Tco_0991789 [Tanacetum coccineum]|uniref:Uncharacterized protein n=1 Tax=Tanacetum coccineum TaxID=301880 RepID=A0ABQ5F0H3_9ASTR
MLGVGYRKGNGPNQPLESTFLKIGFSRTWRLLMAYILGGNIGSKDQLNYMHQLIAHGLINGVKLDYGGIIFNDLAAKLTNSLRHTSRAYARFISLILEKALGDSYVLSDEIGLKIPIMGKRFVGDIAVGTGRKWLLETQQFPQSHDQQLVLVAWSDGNDCGSWWLEPSLNYDKD